MIVGSWVATSDRSNITRTDANASVDVSDVDRRAPVQTSDIPQPSINEKTGVRWYRDLPYATDASDEFPEVLPHPKQRLDLYLPRDENWIAGGRSLLIWIHGGGWVFGDKDQAFGLYGRYCRKLAEHGIAAANVGYRLSPEVQHPLQIQDIVQAIAWLVQHEQVFQYDASQIFISGHSAGGHLAAIVAVDDRYLSEAGVADDVIIGVIPSSGVFDLRPLFGNTSDRTAAFNRHNAADASPISHVDADDPPFVFIMEEIGQYMRQQSLRMMQALEEGQVDFQQVDMHDVNHLTMLGDLLMDDGIHLTTTIEFIESVLQQSQTSGVIEEDR